LVHSLVPVTLATLETEGFVPVSSGTFSMLMYIFIIY
jgi:hypothetical protein